MRFIVLNVKNLVSLILCVNKIIRQKLKIFYTRSKKTFYFIYICIHDISLFLSLLDAAAFLLTFDKIIKDLTSQEMLHKEAAILSRLIYRMKRKFRSDKGMKSMLKVNKALLRYLSLSLEKEYENLKNHVEIDQKYITLSSKQMVEYVLVKTQGFAKLMLRLEEVSRHAAYFFKCRIGLGHAWSIGIISYAVISRIWYVFLY